METNNFLQLRKIFDQAVLLPAIAWESFLTLACAGDQKLLAEARELLHAHQQAETTAALGVNGLPHGQAAAAARMIGPYRIVRELGAGGMGVVYLAVRDDGTFRKNVAVKVLKANLAGVDARQDLVQRFHQERQVLANLDHPSIARILDGGQTEDGLPYHVMEYVEGLPLDRFCDTQQLDLPDRIRLFLQVVSAVHYLHENLIVHRDLKHSNILVTGDGKVKLLDFGIAKLQTPSSHAPDLTGPGNCLLTPSYASPEQMAGTPLAKSSDIYSLGLILYELITGRLPFADAAEKLTQEPPLPSANIRDDLKRMPETTAQLRRRIVGDLDQIVLLCLRRDPRQRYTTASVLGEDLDCFLDGRSVLARKEPIVERSLRFVRRNRVAVAIAMLILLSGGVGIWKTIQARALAHQIELREAAVKQLLDSLDQNRRVKPDAAAPPEAPGRAMDSSAAPVPRVDDIQRLRHALEQDLAVAWSHQPGVTPQRRALLERALKYLDSVRIYAAQNAVLARELAGAYKDIGALYEPAARERALGAYQNAAVLLLNASGGMPSQGLNDGQWAFLVTRIKTLGGVVPLYTLKPKTEVAAKAIRPELQDNSQPSLDREPQTSQSQDALLLVPVPANPEQYRLAKEKLAVATYRAKQADETMTHLKEETAKIGQQVHPVIQSNHACMKARLESAQKEFEGGDFSSSVTNSSIAYVCASRVLSAVGR